MTPTVRKTVFAWASIAGADAEPVELINVDGREGLYTLGCADPFWLDDVSLGVIVYDGTPLPRPENPETHEQRGAREEKYRAKEIAVKKAYEWHGTYAAHGPHCEQAGCVGKDRAHRHGWRGPR